LKVLMQDWSTDRGRQTSISKDKAQLDETIQKLKEENKAEPSGIPYEVSVPDDHAFAEMIEGETIFLHEDEMSDIEYDD